MLGRNPVRPRGEETRALHLKAKAGPFTAALRVPSLLPGGDCTLISADFWGHAAAALPLRVTVASISTAAPATCHRNMPSAVPRTARPTGHQLAEAVLRAIESPRPSSRDVLAVGSRRFPLAPRHRPSHGAAQKRTPCRRQDRSRGGNGPSRSSFRDSEPPGRSGFANSRPPSAQTLPRPAAGAGLHRAHRRRKHRGPARRDVLQTRRATSPPVWAARRSALPDTATATPATSPLQRRFPLGGYEVEKPTVTRACGASARRPGVDPEPSSQSLELAPTLNVRGLKPTMFSGKKPPGGVAVAWGKYHPGEPVSRYGRTRKCHPLTVRTARRTRWARS
jgi:hypothetical protein